MTPVAIGDTQGTPGSPKPCITSKTVRAAWSVSTPSTQTFPTRTLSGNRPLPFLRNCLVFPLFFFGANDPASAWLAFTLLYVNPMGTFTPKGLSSILLYLRLKTIFGNRDGSNYFSFSRYSSGRKWWS